MIQHCPSSSALLSYKPQTSIQAACELVAPNWPLDRFIAVNPLWEMRHEAIESVSGRLSALADVKTTLDADALIKLYDSGEITDENLLSAAESYKLNADIDELKSAIKYPPNSGFLTVAELADLNRDHHKMRWQDEVVHQLSQFCGEFINQQPKNVEQLFTAWLDFTTHDYGVSLLMGEQKLRSAFEALPADFDNLFVMVASEFGLSAKQLEIYAHKLLLSINGWASYFAWRRWEERLQGNEPRYLESLLAIRMAWDLVIWRQHQHKKTATAFLQLKSNWHQQLELLDEHIVAHQNYVTYLWVWMRAAEAEFQQSLHHTLRHTQAQVTSTPVLQAVFCIDVRSERIRRALEQQHPAIQTIGFAGFFGLPIAFQPASTGMQRPQLPGLIAPQITATEKTVQPVNLNKISDLSRWKEWSSASLSAFSMVETMGWSYAFKLVKDNFLNPRKENVVDGQSHHQHWELLDNGEPLSLNEKSKLAKTVLTGMGLTKDFAPTVLLFGHGSETRNNLHAAGLNCGACGGQSGEVNVRVLAELLNDEDVRDALHIKGITIPAETRFIAGLHNTTTDELRCFDTPSNDEIDLWLAKASAATRRERAPEIAQDLVALDDQSLEKALINRASDWSEVRPEWGLANNAAFIIAPRSRTRGTSLNGRVFLHDYDWHSDTSFALLEQIITAPMLVTHWINMQYNLSVTDNAFFGSGNKLLHNAVGDHIGVFEGNGGDLRVGLSMQSIHDGTQWRHQPLRLNVYIAAPKQAIDSIVNAQPIVKDLVTNRWLFMFCWGDDNTIECYTPDGWEQA